VRLSFQETGPVGFRRTYYGVDVFEGRLPRPRRRRARRRPRQRPLARRQRQGRA